MSGLGEETRARDVDRRHALKIMALVAAAPSALATCAPGEEDGPSGLPPAPAANPRAAGTPSDPDLLSPVVPWERALTADELESLASLVDRILPADRRSPAASALGCHDFIDEWVSAPYESNRRDQVLVRGGLVWLDAEAARRFGEASSHPPRFRDLAAEARDAILGDIAYLPDAAPERRAAARFFDKVRDLTATAFWTTEEGMRDLEFVGNVPLERWGPPPPEVLRHVGLA